MHMKQQAVPLPRARLRGTASRAVLVLILLFSAVLTPVLGLSTFAASTVPVRAWTVEHIVGIGIGAAGVAVGLWLLGWSGIAVLFLIGSAFGKRPGGLERLIGNHGPNLLKRTVATAVGVGLTVSGVPAFAADGDTAGQTSSGTALTSFGWTSTSPDLTQGLSSAQKNGPPPSGSTTSAEPAATSDSQPSDSAVVTVTAGDSLWSIAAQHLPEDATSAQISAAWPAWYETNSAQIGSDPDHIRPGQKLAVPSKFLA